MKKATIAIRADKRYQNFDTSFLGINLIILMMRLFYLSILAVVGTETSNTWWQKKRLAQVLPGQYLPLGLKIEPNAIYLSPETYFDSDGESYYFKVIRVQERLPVEERQGGFH